MADIVILRKNIDFFKKNKDPPYIEIEIFEKFSIFSTKMRVTNYISTHDNYEKCKII